MLYLSIYFIYASYKSSLKAIKIGYTDDIKSRLATLQCQENNIAGIHNVKPYALRVRHNFLIQKPKAEEFEASLHDKFRAYCIYGEWFHPHSDIKMWIKDNERKLQKELLEA